MIRSSVIAITVSVIMGSVAMAEADPGDVNRGETLSVTCKACHGKNGITQHAMHPNLAGQNEVYLVWQLTSFKNDTRVGHHMNEIAKRLSEQDINDLAAYYSQINVCE